MIWMSRWVVVLAAASSIGGCLGTSCGDCADDGPPPRFAIPEGLAQKGPLVPGSFVTIRELDAGLERTGIAHEARVDSPTGHFATVERSHAAWVEVSAEGAYLDEFSGRVVDGQARLTGLNDLAIDTRLNVNVLTTMARSRIARLVTVHGLPFSRAREQAEGEVLAAFGIRGGNRFGAFSTLALGGRGEGDRMLAALTGLVISGSDAAGTGALLAAVQGDIALHGSITSEATRAVLAAAARRVNLARLALNLRAWFGPDAATPAGAEFGQWLDADGDGVVTRSQFVVPDAAASPLLTLTPDVVAPFAGATIEAEQGDLHVAGALAAAPQVLRAGESVAIAAPARWAGPGVLTAYLKANGQRVAGVTFFKGLTAVQVLPAAADLRTSTSRSLQAQATFSDASVADVTERASWSSTAPGVVDVGPGTGIASARAAGPARIAARIGSLVGEAGLTAISSADPVALEITMQPLATGVDIARRLTATATFADGSRQDVSAEAAWSSSQPLVATVSGAWVTGRSLGSTSVAARFAGALAEATVAVTSNAWSPVAAPMASRHGHFAVALADGRVWVGGGNTRAPFAEIFDPQSGLWSTAAGLGVSENAQRAIMLDNSKVLVIGPFTGGLYDARTDRWSATGSRVRSNLQRSSAIRLQDGRVLVAGGHIHAVDSDVGGFRFATSGATEVYDPVSNSWTAAASMLNRRRDFDWFMRVVLLADGRVLVAGGSRIEGRAIDAISIPVHAAEVFDPGSNTWSLLPDPADTRYESLRLLLQDGRALGSPESWTPATGAWSNTGTAIGGIQSLLNDGRVLSIGYSVAGVFDPAANAWTPIAPGAAPRSALTVTLLPGGAWLVLGGLRISAAADPSLVVREAELFWR